MAKHVNTIVKDVIKILKTTPAPNLKKKTLWEILDEQSELEGVWDEKLMDIVEGEINSKLNEFSEEDFRHLWEETPAALDNFDDRDSISFDTLKDDLTEEILNLVMEKLDEESSRGFEGTKYFNREDDDDIDDLGFSERDDFSDDNGFYDDDRY
jgi:hypothetical protein